MRSRSTVTVSSLIFEVGEYTAQGTATILPPACDPAPLVERTVYAMQPVFRSSTTSLIVPISSPCDDFTFVPTILLAWT
jgi:hypothetical protein